VGATARAQSRVGKIEKECSAADGHSRQHCCCSPVPEACRKRLWRIKKTVPKTLPREWARIDRLSSLPYRPRADLRTGLERKG